MVYKNSLFNDDLTSTTKVIKPVMTYTESVPKKGICHNKCAFQVSAHVRYIMVYEWIFYDYYAIKK